MRHVRWPKSSAALAALATSAIMLSPFMNFAHMESALHAGDGRLYAWIISWIAHALSHGTAVFDSNMFYPGQATLAQTDLFLSLGVLGMPLWLTTGNAVLTFNVLQLLGPSATAFAAFLLFRTWTDDWLASLVGGLVFGISLFALLHNAHLGLTWAAGLPLTIMLFDRWWQEPTWSKLGLLWIGGVGTVLTSWYLAAMLIIVVALRVAPLIFRATRADLALRLPQAVAGAALAAAVVLPFAYPYIGRGNDPGEAAALAADLRSYLVPPEHTVLGRWLFARGLVGAQGIWGERTLFLGWVAIAIACIGLFNGFRSQALERRARTWFLVVLLAAGAGLSFGPTSTGLAPHDLLAHLPGFGGFRASGRFALLVAFAVGALAAFGLADLRRVVPRAAPVIIVALTVVMMVERFVVDFPAGRPQPESMPEAYRLARADGARAAMALPMYAGQAGWFFETDYLLYSTTADFLPLANGYGRWPPSEYLALAEAMRDFPSSASANALRFYGITHVILHSARYGDAGANLRESVRQSADFTTVAERGSDVLLRLTAH